MEQSTLSNISEEESGPADDEDDTPGVDPRDLTILPRKLPHNQEGEDDDTADDHGDELDPMFQGERIYGPCPVCGERSPVNWRCVDCGKLFDSVETKGLDRRPTAVRD